MNTTRTVPEHDPNTPNTEPEQISTCYTAQAIADENADLRIKADTVRLRWFAWISQVAPEPLLKVGGLYTELARELFNDFAHLCKRKVCMKPNEWVVDAKQRYSEEWGNAGIIADPLIPEEVGGALALIQTSALNLHEENLQERTAVDLFLDAFLSAEEDFSEAELRTFKEQGMKRGLMRFKVETQAELEVYNELKRRRLEQ